MSAPTADDIPELARLKTQVARRTYGPSHAGPALERWLAKTAGEDHFRYRVGRFGYHMQIARDASRRIVGVATFRQRGERADGNAGGIYVLEPGRGIGRQLEQWREQRARELGCTRMRVSCFDTNEPAKAFVAASGYGYTKSVREPTLGVRIRYFERDL